MKIAVSVVLSLLLTLLSHTALAEQAGLVLMAKGGVFAIDANGKKRALRRRSPINEGDTVTTDAKGKLQIRFIDKALLTLKPDSKLDISAYQQAKAEGKDEKVVMNLITGGFRTITGSIGKGEKSAYTVKTPAASIGIRGTNYEVAQESAGNYVMAVWEGGITVSNDQGSINIGQGGDYNFVRVTPSSEPKGLEKAPESLKTATPPPPKEKSEKEKSTKGKAGGNKDGDKDVDKTDKDGNNTDDANSETDDEENKDGEGNADEADETAEETDTEGNSVADGSSDESNVEGDAKDSQLEEELEEAEDNALAVEDEPLDPIVVEPSADSRFNDYAYSNLLQRPRGALLINNDSGEMTAALTISNSETDTDPTIVLPGGSLGSDNNFSNFTLDTSSTSSIEYVAQVGGSEFVSWGKWNGSVDIFSTSNSAANDSINKDFYWLSAEAAALSTLRGTATFSGNSEYLGDVNGESINSLNGQFDVNFTNGTIENGSLNFSSDSQDWDITFDGQVLGSQATMGNIQGSITDNVDSATCSTCVQGNVQGTFARPGDTFAGGMQLESSDGTQNAQGVFMLKGQRTGN